jgi:two-component system KDP operon response regulator KdpE
MKSVKVLVVDDEIDINEIISTALEGSGYESNSVFTLSQARKEIKTGTYSLVLLDLTLPDGDGIELLKEIRSTLPKLPVIVLTAKVSPSDIDLGLESGATDYLGKPFRVKELLLRSKNILARNANEKLVYSYKNCSLDSKQRKFFIGNQEVKLTYKEYQFLLLLIANQDKLQSRASIYDSIWGVIEEPDYHRLEAIVSNLRKKLKQYGFTSIKTNSKSGYTLE